MIRHRTLTFVLALAFAILLVGVPSYASDWQPGYVFAGVSNGTYYVYDNTGNYIESISSGSGFTTGCAFNNDRTVLYTTYFSTDDVVKFDVAHPHPVLGTIDVSTTGSTTPESVVFDAAGTFYVGTVGSAEDLLKYDAADLPQASFDTATGNRGTDWIDLASDQVTMFYTSEDPYVRRYDVATGTQLADFASGGTVQYALRILTDGSGGVLVANTGNIRLLDSAGNEVQTYDVTGEDSWFALNLDPNGTSFWSGNFSSANFYRFNIASGAVEIGPINTGTGSSTLFGLCVLGEPTAAQGIPAHIDIKFCSNPNAHNCKSGGVLPVTVFGTDVLDVNEIDIATAELCLASDHSVCVGPPKTWSIADRGDPTTDLGAAMCAIDPVTGDELNWLNQDGNPDIDFGFDKKDVTEVLLGDCDGLAKGDVSETLIFKALTYDGTVIASTAVDDVGIDQLLRQQ